MLSVDFQRSNLTFWTANYSLMNVMIWITFTMWKYNGRILSQTTNIVLCWFQRIQTEIARLRREKRRKTSNMDFLNQSLYSIFIKFIPFELSQNEWLFIENQFAFLIKSFANDLTALSKSNDIRTNHMIKLAFVESKATRKPDGSYIIYKYRHRLCCVWHGVYSEAKNSAIYCQTPP